VKERWLGEKVYEADATPQVSRRGSQTNRRIREVSRLHESKNMQQEILIAGGGWASDRALGRVE